MDEKFLDKEGLTHYTAGMKKLIDEAEPDAIPEADIDDMLKDVPDGEELGGDESTGSGIDVTAAVGQTIIVEEVDENGKPTKWKAADYQPRTHWEEGTGEVLFDGTFSIKKSTTQDILFASPIVDGKCYAVEFDGVKYVRTAYVDDEGSVTIGALYDAENQEYDFTDTPFAIWHDSGNIHYFVFPSATTGDFSLKVVDGAVHPLSEKFIPDTIARKADVPSSWNDLPGRPFGESDNAVLLPETQFSYDSSMGLFYTPGYIEFVEGKTYTVNWNGVDYQTEAVPGQFNGEDLVMLGNPAALGGTNNNLPFAVACLMGSIGAIPLDGSTAVSVGITGFGIVPIPAKYKNEYHFKLTITTDDVANSSSYNLKPGSVAMAEYVLQSGGDLYLDVTRILTTQGNLEAHHIMRLVAYGKDLRKFSTTFNNMSKEPDPNSNANCLAFDGGTSYPDKVYVLVPQADGTYIF